MKNINNEDQWILDLYKKKNPVEPTQKTSLSQSQKKDLELNNIYFSIFAERLREILFEDIPIFFKTIFIRSALILGILTVLYMSGDQEIHNILIGHETRDIGSLIMIFGILFTISSFVSISSKLSSWILYTILGIYITVFGYIWFDYGLAYSLISISIFIMLIAYIYSAFNPFIGRFLMITGIILFLLFISLGKFSIPSKIPEEKNKMVNVQVPWKMELIIDYKYPSLSLPISKTDKRALEILQSKKIKLPSICYQNLNYGNEIEIISNAKKILNEINNINNEKIYAISIKCLELPKEYTLRHGYPNIYWYPKYVK